jgi:hypothetical protein
MTSTKTRSAAARARWLSELAQAIDEAQWLAWRIGVVEGRNPEALELYVRLEIARAEVEALRGSSIGQSPADKHGHSIAFPTANPRPSREEAG